MTAGRAEAAAILIVAALGWACGMASGAEGAAGATWPCFRGPSGDGTSPQVPAEMPTITLEWKHPMAGQCSAGVVAAEGFVVVADSDGNSDRNGVGTSDYYRCYDAMTGKAAWVFPVRTGKKMDYGNAPRAMPCIHEGKVFCIGAFGDLHCLDLKTGKALWEKSFKDDFGARELPTWGYCTAPCIADGKLIIQPKDVVALEPATGKTLWTGKSAGPNYSTFLAGTFGGVRQVIGYDARSLAGWNLKTGTRLWELAVDNSKGYIVPSPVAVGDKLLLTTEDEDTRLYGFDKEGKLIDRPEAENDDLTPEMATPTLQGDLVLGISHGLVCLDPKAKLKTLWIQEKEDAFQTMGHIVAGKDRAFVFGDNGTLVLLKAEPKQCTILGKAKLCDTTWTCPALAYGRIYIRDEKTFFCYRLAGKAIGVASSPAGR